MEHSGKRVVPLVGSPKLGQGAGRNHHKNSVESTKIPRPNYILSGKQSERLDSHN